MRITNIGRYVIGAVAGALLLFAVSPAPKIDPVYTRGVLILDRKTLEEGKPDAELSLPERIVKRNVEPTVTAIAPGGATEIVQEFVESVHEHATRDTATTMPADSAKPLRVLAFPTAGKWDGRTHTFWMARSDGAAGRLQFPARYRFEWSTSGDSIVFHEERFGAVRQIVPLAPCVAGGVVAGRTGEPLVALGGCALSILWMLR